MDPLDDLPEVRIAACRCVILASTPPVGYTFRATHIGEHREPVYACSRHSADLQPKPEERRPSSRRA